MAGKKAVKGSSEQGPAAGSGQSCEGEDEDEDSKGRNAPIIGKDKGGHGCQAVENHLYIDKLQDHAV